MRTCLLWSPCGIWFLHSRAYCNGTGWPSKQSRAPDSVARPAALHLQPSSAGHASTILHQHVMHACFQTDSGNQTSQLSCARQNSNKARRETFLPLPSLPLQMVHERACCITMCSLKEKQRRKVICGSSQVRDSNRVTLLALQDGGGWQGRGSALFNSGAAAHALQP
jgi:hypothetical protein